eukprot:CAMPEP_0182614198 /NCGR_PEP_ID=MMETSP1330-20130603/29285_1 /TAXON_ID=464278 /ORGANISM="Picochlorum sp., Strain RCC944" /LENGTH=274 /DNA_ID=CAMNT_0024833995 /DNA_START=40 /DNA_END=861 /DNA_ORIENTATION=+
MNLSAKPLHVQLKNAGTSRACKIKSKVAPIQVQERTKSTQLQSCFSSSSSSCNRRKALGVVVAAPLLTTVRPKPAAAIAEKPVEVSNYLPSSSGKEGFYEFIPGDRETPAIRAGTIGKYKFDLPGTWVRRTVANILSGNYCQPRCDEPWTEVLFQGPKQGSLQVIVSPLNKLSRRPLEKGESIDTVGTLDGIINALGPNITGNTIEEEEVAKKEAKKINGITYYWYELDTPYAKTGQKQVASIAATENAVFVLAVSATDKQWNQNKDKLTEIAQ